MNKILNYKMSYIFLIQNLEYLFRKEKKNKQQIQQLILSRFSITYFIGFKNYSQ